MSEKRKQFIENVLDKGYIEVVDSLGDDLTPVNAARVSFGGRSDNFTDKLYKRIQQETGVNMKPTRLDNIKSWWINVTTGNKVYLAFWIIFTYILLGIIAQDTQILRSFLEIVLWPLFL